MHVSDALALWLGMVTTLLRDALREDGIGARTRAGYGRLDLDLPAAVGNIAS